MVSGAGSSLLVKDGAKLGFRFLVTSFRSGTGRAKSQVIKHSDAKYCVVMSCVGGEVTVLMEPLWDGRGGRSSASKGRGPKGTRHLTLNPSPRSRRRGRRAEVRLPRAGLLGSVSVLGVWIGARKLEGERDVGRRRILWPLGESLLLTAEPAGPWTARSSCSQS
jgi:hypothetical protein